jgi:hypothetical protein
MPYSDVCQFFLLEGLVLMYEVLSILGFGFYLDMQELQNPVPAFITWRILTLEFICQECQVRHTITSPLMFIRSN